MLSDSKCVAEELVVCGTRIRLDQPSIHSTRRYFVKKLNVEPEAEDDDEEGRVRGEGEVVKLNSASFPIESIASKQLKSIREATELSTIERFLRNSIKPNEPTARIPRKKLTVIDVDEIYETFYKEPYDRLRGIISKEE